MVQGFGGKRGRVRAEFNQLSLFDVAQATTRKSQEIDEEIDHDGTEGAGRGDRKTLAGATYRKFKQPFFLIGAISPARRVVNRLSG
jgi:hypothetical protein